MSLNEIKYNINGQNQLNISTLLQLIPDFDTSQAGQIYRFARSCDSAFSLADPQQKEILLVYALNKIIGSGAPDVHARQYASWDDLKTFLISKFSNIKTISHLNLELQSMFQKPNEPLVDYFHRVDLCRSKIIEKLTTEITDITLDGRKATTEETALNVFINGLNTDIGTMLRTKGFNSLSEAGNFAIQEDKIRAMNNARQTLYRVSNSRTAPGTNQNFRSFRPRPTINNQIQSSQQNQPSSFSSNNAKTCNYCKLPGHLISECRKRAYNNNLRNSNNPTNTTPNQRPALPPARVNNLNYQASDEMGNSSETALALQTDSNLTEIQTDLDNIQFQD